MHLLVHTRFPMIMITQKVEKPAQQCLCPKTFGACNRRHICAANAKLNLQSIPIRNILAVGIYQTKAAMDILPPVQETVFR